MCSPTLTVHKHAFQTLVVVFFFVVINSYVIYKLLNFVTSFFLHMIRLQFIIDDQKS